MVGSGCVVMGESSVYNKWVEIFLDVNKELNFLIVGHAALTRTGLIHGTTAFDFYTPYPGLHLVRYPGNIMLTHYNFTDSEYLTVFDEDRHIYLPTKERAIVDGMAWCKQSYSEGELIEAVQNYDYANNGDFAEVYKVAEHYNVDRSIVDYWIDEARNESDMSMG